LEGFYDDPAINEISNFGLSVQGDFEFEKFSVTSITAFRNNDVLDNQDIDFSSADLTNSNKNDINIDTFTQEIRFVSNGDGAVDWLVGAFYFDESVEQETDVLFGPSFRSFIDILLGQAGVPFGLSTVEALSGIPQGSFYQNNSGVSDVATLDNKAISLFGQFDWRMSDSLTATLGLNYTDDEKDYSIISNRTEVRGMFNLGPLNFVPIFPPVQTDTNNPVEDNSTADDKVTYTARLAWDMNDTFNSYVTYATGYKASSVNLSRDSNPSPADFAAIGSLGLLAANTNSGRRFADPEEAKVIELGLKARFDRGTLNIAVFDQTLDNFQSNIFVGDAFVLANAERQSVKGAEVSFNYQPTDSFSYGANVTLLDPLYDSFTGASAGDLSGLQPAGIAEISASFSAQYTFMLGGNDAYVRGDYQYEDEVLVVDGIGADIATREVKLLNMSAGMTTESGMSYTLWARNLADESFLISAFPSVAQAGSFSGYRNEPRTFGVTVRKDF
ncbi:MAG: outer membrane receptor protein involved in Fe transport, partial [Arenicella sp.]